MAFLKDPSEEDDLLTAKPVDGSTGAGFAGDAPSGGASPTATSSGNYTNLQDYLSGNQTGAQKMADNITADVSGKVDTANQSNKAYTDTASKVIGDAQTGKDYAGPSDYSQLSGDAASAQSKARADTKVAADTAGQVGGGFDTLGAYLKGQVKDPGYSGGENGLDTFLTGASAPGQDAINKAKGYKGIAAASDAADAAVNGAIAAQRAKPDKVFSPVLEPKGVGVEAISFPASSNSVPTSRTMPMGTSLPFGIPNSGREQVQNYPTTPVAQTPTSRTMPTSTSLPFGIPNSGREQVQNYPATAVAQPAIATRSGSGGSNSRLAKFATGGLVEAEEKTSYAGLISKLKGKKA